MMKGVVIWGAVAFTAMALAGILAGIKNRNVNAWVAWGFIVPPSVLVLLMLPTRAGPRPRPRRLDDEDDES